MKIQNKLILFALTVLLFRMVHTGTLTFSFLVWNLFLVWVPFALSTKHKKKTRHYLVLFAKKNELRLL